MKRNKDRSFRKASSWTALVLASAASASVLLSISLLFGYVSQASERHKSMEIAAQVTLSHDSAVEYATLMYASESISPEDFVPPVETGGMISQFRIIESIPLESRTLRYEFPEVSEISVVPTRDGLMVAGNAVGSVIVYLRELDTDRNRSGFPIAVCSIPDSWILAECVPEIEPLGILACNNTGIDVLITISANGTSSVYPLGDFEISESSVITTGLAESVPVVVITDGTCPVITPDGRIFGETPSVESDVSVFDPHFIEDVFFGDFDLDGNYDTAWVSKGCLACMSSASGILIKDEVESAELIAWGYIEGRHGLGGLWNYDDSEIHWRKYLVNGFQNLDNYNTALNGYNGRIYSYQNTFTGLRNEHFEVINSDSSYRNLVVIDRGTPKNFNGSGGIDIAVISEENLLLHLDPSGSEDVLMDLEISTGMPGEEPVLNNKYTFRVSFPNRDRMDMIEQRGGIRG